MFKLHPNYLEKDGKKEFAVIPYEEFVQLQEELANYEDLRLLRDAKEKEGNSPTIAFEKAKKELGL